MPVQSLYVCTDSCIANSELASMMDASRLADSRRAEYGEEEIANSVLAVGTSPDADGSAAADALASISA